MPTAGAGNTRGSNTVYPPQSSHLSCTEQGCHLRRACWGTGDLARSRVGLAEDASRLGLLDHREGAEILQAHVLAHCEGVGDLIGHAEYDRAGAGLSGEKPPLGLLDPLD